MTALCFLLLLGRVQAGVEQYQSETRLAQLYNKGLELVAARQYLQAASFFDQCHQEAQSRHDLGHRKTLWAVRALTSLGSARFDMFQYRQAMEAYLEARRMAESSGDRMMVGVVSMNISALYSLLSMNEEAFQEAERGLRALELEAGAEFRSKLLLHKARLHSKQGQIHSAIPLFREAIEEADRRGDTSTQAFGWEQLGLEFLRRWELDLAERALVEAFRLRKMHGNRSAYASYHSLGKLRLTQGDPAAALRLIDLAIDAARPTTEWTPIWRLYHSRARALRRLGRLAEAYVDLKTAIEQIRDWRLALLPADSARTSAGGELQEVYSLFIEIGNALWLQSGRLEFARATFEAAEADRAASLRETLRTFEDHQRRLPPPYWETLAQLQAAEASLISRESAGTRNLLRSLRLRLTEMEVTAGLRHPSKQRERTSVESVQNFLKDPEALLSIYVGEERSYLWALTAESFEMHELPPRAAMLAHRSQWLGALRESSHRAVTSGAALYHDLFGSLSPVVLRKARWMLALDPALLEMPFAALVAGHREGSPVFLLELHSLQLVPSAAMLADPRIDAWSGSLLAVGDPVYNTADPRWASTSNRRRAWFGLPDGGFELPRLPGSLMELEACARAWGSGPVPPVLLVGNQARWPQIAMALRERPSIVHFATHMVPSPWNSRESLLALGLSRSGELELLNSASISAAQVRSRLVVMSGCSSGAGQALPGEGLMGLTRAWLAAGAEAVAATLWATPDHSGELLQSFYKHLRPSERGGSTDHALRLAQLEMLGSATWRSKPSYWAAYFVMGKS